MKYRPLMRTVRAVSLAMMLGELACGPAQPAESLRHVVQGGLSSEPDLSTPIGQKWYRLGGLQGPGAAVADVASLPDGSGQYQKFVNGVITFTNEFGALIMPTAIFERWLSGAYLQFGAPVMDTVSGPAMGGSQEVTYVAFERGLIDQDGSSATFLVEQVAAGEYLRGCANGESTCRWRKLGNPVAESAWVANPLRVQHFQGGAIYYDTQGGAALWGPILQKYEDGPMPLSVLHRPTSGPEDVLSRNGVVLGEVATFMGGSIFHSTGTGAHLVTRSLLGAYNGRYGGPSGWLGFPVGDTGAQSTGPFNDFEHGMLIARTGTDGAQGIHALGDLSFKVASASIWATDGGGGSNETYVLYSVSASNGAATSGAVCSDHGVIRCEDGDVSEAWDEEIAPNKVIPLGVASSQMSIALGVSLWDYDNGANGGDDLYGVWQEQHSASDLFGTMGFGEHTAPEGSATFGIQSTHGYDGSDFMGNRWWSFRNWDTDDITYNQYAQAFEDVGPDESTFWHPFNHIWYELAIRNLAEGGNCFGMALASIYAEKGLGPFPEPIIDYFSNTQGGQRLGDVAWTPAHAALANEINVRHAYQMGSQMIRYYMTTLNEGATHAPRQVFDDVANALGAQRPILIGLSTFFWKKGHALRAYGTEEGKPCTMGGVSPCNRIYIADPNFPKVLKNPTFIEIDSQGRFSYDAGFYKYDGTAFSGDRMFSIPYDGLLDHQASTPFNLFEIAKAALFILGNDGALSQVTNEKGNTLFKPGLAALPSRWDDLNANSSGMREMTPVPVLEETGAQVVSAGGEGGTYAYDVVAAPGVAPGTPFEAAFVSSYLSLIAVLPGTPGKPDRITAHNINTPNKSVTLAMNPMGPSKTVQITLGAAEKHRWVELSDIALSPGQQMTMTLGNGGYTLSISNEGPATSALLKVSSGPGTTPVEVGRVQIPEGATTVEYQVPTTTLSVSGQVPGNDGWFLAPLSLELSAQDYSGQGIARIEHRRDQLAWESYACPTGGSTCSTGRFPYDVEGTTTLSYRAVDRAQNIEGAKKVDLKIDSRKPIATAFTDRSSYTRVDPFVVHASASDPMPGSGLKSATSTLDSQATADGQVIDLLWLPLGKHTVTVAAEDMAGWHATASADFELTATAESLKALIQRLRAMGEIDSDGVANSLLEKVEHNSLGALLNQIQAQAGKHVSQRAGVILQSDVQYLMDR